MFSENILNENFIKLVGTTSQINGYGAIRSFYTVKKKFSVRSDEWEKNPICPKDYKGDEYYLIR